MTDAIFSPDRVYRYTLNRNADWFGRETINFVMLNPSTADETTDDPTIRRCVGYAKRWGYGALVVTNLFAFRATDPKDMKAAVDPIGEENDRYLLEVASDSAAVICAWGVHGEYRDRGRSVLKILEMERIKYLALRLTKQGHPSHPLYLPSSANPVAFAPFVA